MNEEVHKELNCPICMDILKVPKLLTCMHTFCESCLVPLIADNQIIFCPVCRHETKLTDGTASLSNNFIAQNVVEALETMTLTSNGVVICGECEQDVAVNFCCDCYQKLCEVCTEYHKRSVKYRDHSVSSFRDVSQKQMSQGKIKKCGKHDEVLKYYCKECQFTICHDCTVSKNHTGHEFNLLDEIASENKEILQSLVSQAEKKQRIVERITTEAEKELVRIKKEHEVAITVINETFQHLYDVIQRQQCELIQKFVNSYEKNVISINNTKDNTRILAECVSFTKKVIENRCNAEVMGTFQNLKRQLEEISKMKLLVKPKRRSLKEEINKETTKKVKRVSFCEFPLYGSKLHDVTGNESNIQTPQCRNRTSTAPESCLKKNPSDFSEHSYESINSVAGKKKFKLPNRISIKSMAAKSSKGVKSSLDRLSVKKNSMEQQPPNIMKEVPYISNPIGIPPTRPPPAKLNLVSSSSIPPARPTNPPPKPPAPKKNQENELCSTANVCENDQIENPHTVMEVSGNSDSSSLASSIDARESIDSDTPPPVVKSKIDKKTHDNFATFNSKLLPGIVTEDVIVADEHVTKNNSDLTTEYTYDIDETGNKTCNSSKLDDHYLKTQDSELLTNNTSENKKPNKKEAPQQPERPSRFCADISLKRNYLVLNENILEAVIESLEEVCSTEFEPHKNIFEDIIFVMKEEIVNM